jgi:hypothetical protein
MSRAIENQLITMLRAVIRAADAQGWARRELRIREDNVKQNPDDEDCIGMVDIRTTELATASQNLLISVAKMEGMIEFLSLMYDRDS